jgi:uncharacterized protein
MDKPDDDHRPEWRQVVQEKALQATLREARERWGQESPNFNYRWEHIQTVARLALRLAKLTGADPEIVEAAAWLHDICKQGRDDNHGLEGAIAAREILARTNFSPAKIESVAEAIAKHVGLVSTDPDAPLEAAVLWDADKLSKMGFTAVLHFTGYRMMCSDPIDTQYLVERLSDQPWQPEAVESFHTEAARAAGRRRLAAFTAFWEQIRDELTGDDLA